MRRQAACLTLTIVEFFRNLHKDVLVLINSATRFAMAQREIGLSAGTITRIFSVLVDGDDHNGSMAYAVRRILDSHIVMDRAIAERGCYPAINVRKSKLRTMPRAADPAYLPAINWANAVISTYSDMEELIRLGACRAGPGTDRGTRAPALTWAKPSLCMALEDFIGQIMDESTSMTQGYRRLRRILQANETEN